MREKGEREGEDWVRERESYVMYNSCVFNTWTFSPSPAHPRLFLDVAGFFVCLVLTEHVLRFEPYVGHPYRDSVL